MRRLLAACCLLLLCVVPLAHATVSLPVPWKPGMQLRYRSVSSQEKVRGKLHSRVQTQDITEITVLSADDSGSVQQWRSVSPEVAVTGDGDQVASERRMAQALVKRFAALPLQARIDAAGNYQGLSNWEALAVAMREAMLPVMLEQAAKRKDLAGVEAAELRARLAPALERMTTQAAVDAGLGRQVAIFNYFIAPSLEPGKLLTYEDNIASPWSADLIPSKGSFELLSADPGAGTVTIRWRQGIDPRKGVEVAWKMVQSITGVRRGQLGSASDLPKGLELQDEATVVLERATGVPIRLEHRRHLALGSASTTNRWTLERLPARGAK